MKLYMKGLSTVSDTRKGLINVDDDEEEDLKGVSFRPALP